MNSCSYLILAIATLAIVQINATPIVEDIYGNEYYMIPIRQSEEESQQSQSQSRARRSASPQRETTYDLGNQHVGLGQKYTFVDNDKHQLSANAYASRDYAPKGPLTTGQGAEYLHKPSGSNFQINAENTRGYGTDVTASGTYNFFQTQDKRGKIGVSGDYQRQFGGPCEHLSPTTMFGLRDAMIFKLLYSLIK